MNQADQFAMLIRIDERTEMLMKKMVSMDERLDNLDCKTQTEKVNTLNREIKIIKSEKLPSRVGAIEKVFWPSFVSGVGGFVTFLYFIIKSFLGKGAA